MSLPYCIVATIHTSSGTDTSELAALINKIGEKVGAIEKLGDKVDAMDKKLMLLQYSNSHILSGTSQTALDKGAMFFVTDGCGGQPIFVGFFISATLALTINHDAMFDNGPPAKVFAVSSASNRRELEFECLSTHPKLDFSVLRLLGDPSPAFFSLQSFPSVGPGQSAALVTMGIRARLAAEAALPTVTVHSVTVTSVTEDNILHDGAATWFGDSGGALVFEEGYVIAMHVEVIDDHPDSNAAAAVQDAVVAASAVSESAQQGTGEEAHTTSQVPVRRSPRPAAAGAAAAAPMAEEEPPRKRRRRGVKMDARSVAVSSRAAVGRALLLSSPAVRAVLSAAGYVL